MAEEKDKEVKEIDKDEVKFDNNYLSESFTKKFIKTGLLAIGASVLFKGKKPNDDLLRIGTTAAATMALSEDKDYSKDAIVLASLFGVKHAVGLGKALALSNPDYFQQVYKYAEKADDIAKKFNLASMNLTEKAKETYVKNLTRFNLSNPSTDNKSIYSNITHFFKSQGSAIFNTGKDSLSYLYHNGVSKSLEEISNNTFYNQYKSTMKDIDIKELEILSNDIKSKFNLNIKDMEVNSFASGLDYLLNVITPDKFFTSKQEQFQKATEIIKKYKKFQRIEEGSFFTDMLGMYSKLEDGKINVRMDKILEDRMHFADTLNQLAKNFKHEIEMDMPVRAKRISSDVKEAMFLDYLNKNGFQELIEKSYKQDELLSFSEVNEMFKDSSNGIDEFLRVGKKSAIGFTKETTTNTRELENLDILKNFAFTNVIKKTSNGFFDETALNGHINLLQGLGVVEKTFVGTFKIPVLDKVWNTWNPFKLIESDARIKNELVNNVLGLHYNNQGFMLNGKRISTYKIDTFKETIRNGKVVNKTPYEIVGYKSYDERDVKIIFNKNLLGLTNEEFSVARNGHKKEKITYSYLWSNLKKRGLKDTASKFTYSMMNPFSFRYNHDGNSLRKSFQTINVSDGYFKDGTFFTQYLSKADIDVSKMRAENKLIETYINEIREGLITTLFKMSDEDKITKMVSELYDQLNDKVTELDSLLPNNKKISELHEYVFNKILPDNNKTFNEKLLEISSKVKSYAAEGNITRKESGILSKLYYDIAGIEQLEKGYYYSVFYNIPDAKRYFLQGINDEDSIIYSSLNEMIDKIHNPKAKEFFIKSKELAFKYDQSIKRVETHVNDLLHQNSASKYYNFVDEYILENHFSDEHNIFNPIYEILKGKELNVISKNFLDEDYLNIAVANKYIQKTGRAPRYSNTTIGSFVEKAKELTGRNEKMLYNESYKIFDEIESTIIAHNKIQLDDIEERINKKTFDVLIEEYNQIKYTSQKDTPSSVMIRQTELSHRNMKNVLNRVRESIYNAITGKQLEKDELDSKMNLLSKIAISQLQDALEYVGVERLTQKKLGSNAIQQMYNFMKYRYLPLTAIVGGVIAADTLSDALVPDDVPIIGNGVSGVAIKGIAASRIGLQYMLQGTGMLSLMRGMENAVPGLFNNAIGDSLDILMSPSEMIDVYFRGKPIEIKDNRWWFTAGRQSGQGEEFRQYRPHLWYIWQNKDSGIYSNKFEKLFRRDFALTKYPWYLLDPYKEEREAYEKYGAVYPMTEQLFLEVPVIGQFLNATIGEVIKPTQYICEERWRVGDDMMLNPNYNPNDPSSPKYIKFSQPNKFVKSIFEAVEDLKTFAGIQGYGVTKITEALFGSSNPYQNEVGLASIDQDTGLYARYDRLQLGDLFGMTEPIRRLVDDSNSLGMIKMNPLEQNLPDWMPDYFKHGNNPYLSWDFGNYILPSREFDRNSNMNVGNEELNQFRVLSLTAPSSDAFIQLQSSLGNRVDDFTREQQTSYYESMSFANNYGKREYLNRYYGKAPDIEDIQLKIDKKISPYEFISGGKRYKFDSVTDDFNKLSERYGSKKATKMINDLDDLFKEGQTYNFKISQDASYSVGIDGQGDYFRIDSDSISNKYNLEHSSYRKDSFFGKAIRRTLFAPFTLAQNSPVNIAYEKIFGVKDVYNEWSAETVQAPFFRDWDTPVSSFLEPFYTYSSNSITSAFDFGRYSNSIYLNSNASFNVLGTLNKLGALKLPYNKITGKINKSSQYDDETKVHDELEKIKFIAGDKSFYNMTGKENVKQFSKMLNEQDAEFLEDLANVSNKEEREKILKSSNERLSKVLKTIWNRHQMAINNTVTYDDIEQPMFDNVMNIGAYYGNSEEARNIIKTRLGINLSKLDVKRQGVFNAYRGSAAEREAQFIANRMYGQYNSRPNIISTIYGKGIINVNQRRGEDH